MWTLTRSSCGRQRGHEEQFRNWPVSAIPMRVSDVGFERLGGLSRDRQTMPAYDPKETLSFG